LKSTNPPAQPPEASAAPAISWVRRPDFVYAAALFIVAAVVLATAIVREGGFLTSGRYGVALFFLLYGLFTITTGYHHPRIGYVSFDRVSQVASILVLGPVDAAWVNGLASLIYPWHRLWQGTPFRRVMTASLNNAGLMTMMVIGGGLLYEAMGGQIPLTRLDWTGAALLPLLILSMQLINEIGMGIHMHLREGRLEKHLNRFVLALESISALAAVLLAIVFNNLPTPVVILLLVLVSTVMLVLTQFARMRLELETIIADRTRVLREKTVELEHLATRDQLTGLFNRRYVDGYLEGRIEEFNRYGRRFGIALIDLDHFKRINDQQSHEVGDEVLKQVARILTERCRETDVVARYGGEEFLLCFPEAEVDEVTFICEQLREAVAGANWSSLAPDISVSLSAGVAAMRPGLTRSALVNAADHKLYKAKNAGRNLVLS
jgi:diguanylate cyclase (GGDEF)-like protein